MIRICNHDFRGRPSFNIGFNRRCVDVVVPIETSTEVLEELKEADHLDLIGDFGDVIGTYRLTEWIAMEKVYDGSRSGIAIRWNTVTLDEVDRLKQEIEDLRSQNADLTEENNILTDALLELAEVIGGEE